MEIMKTYLGAIFATALSVVFFLQPQPVLIGAVVCALVLQGFEFYLALQHRKVTEKEDLKNLEAQFQAVLVEFQKQQHQVSSLQAALSFSGKDYPGF